jgi:hypothetical protein
LVRYFLRAGVSFRVTLAPPEPVLAAEPDRLAPFFEPPSRPSKARVSRSRALASRTSFRALPSTTTMYRRPPRWAVAAREKPEARV